jgi:hypothetical protein
MARETIRTHDAEVYVGFPTTDQDDPSVQVGVSYGDSVGWAVLTSPDQVADLRRVLQRASRKVWPDAPAPLLAPDLVLPSSVFGPVATGLVTPADDA